MSAPSQSAHSYFDPHEACQAAEWKFRQSVLHLLFVKTHTQNLVWKFLMWNDIWLFDPAPRSPVRPYGKFFTCILFFTPSPLISYTLRLNTVSTPKSHQLAATAPDKKFKRHLLLNHWSKFKIISEKCSLWFSLLLKCTNGFTLLNKGLPEL